MSIYSNQTECVLPLPNTRKLAKQLNIKHYFTGKSCKDSHVSRRHSSSGYCVECQIVRKRERREENPEYYHEQNRKYRIQNRGNILESQRKYRKKNRKILNEKNREYGKNNRDKINAKTAKHRAKKLAQTPDDANHELIKGFYTCAKELNEIYGCDLEVDHIIPIDKGGLHSEHNLQLLPESLNRSKGAKLNWKHPKNIDEQPLTDEMIEWLECFN